MTDQLQFDHAEFSSEDGTAAKSCAVCERELVGTYYLANGAKICSECRTRVGAAESNGSAQGRFGKALALGLLGGIVGAAIYFGIVKVTGYEIGLVAIAVGFLVGAGVRLGAGGRGGWVYQLMAVGLTYCAIASTYVPYILNELDAAMIQGGKELATQTDAPRVAILRDQTVLLNGEQVSVEQLRTELATSDEASIGVLYFREGMESEAPPPVAGEVTAVIEDLGLPRTAFQDAAFTEPTPILAGLAGVDLSSKLILAGTLFAFAAVSPFLGLPENLIGLLIIGFALYQAWSMNRRVDFEIEGPLELADSKINTPEPPAGQPV